jgi:hypothetical protein
MGLRGFRARSKDAEREDRGARDVEGELVVALANHAAEATRETRASRIAREAVATTKKRMTTTAMMIFVVLLNLILLRDETGGVEGARESAERAVAVDHGARGHHEGDGGGRARRVVRVVARAVRGRRVRREGEDDVALRERARGDAPEAHPANAAEHRSVGEVHAVRAQPRRERGELVRGPLAGAGRAQVPERRAGTRGVRAAAAVVPTARTGKARRRRGGDGRSRPRRRGRGRERTPGGVRHEEPPKARRRARRAPRHAPPNRPRRASRARTRRHRTKGTKGNTGR